MKKLIKKLIIIYLMGGLFFAIGKGDINKPKLMSNIDPGPANSVIK